MARMGPWGFWDALVLLLPIAFLVAMVLKPKPMATAKSLWCAAVILFVLKLWYLEASPPEACACFVKGCLQALTPCSIVAGAIFLFDCMESSHSLAWMKVQLRVVTNSHPVAEVMLIGFCFAFVVEGASGFGTPAALAAPMLYSMGHPKMECVVCLLTFNTFMTIFGAVGTPVWFGIGEVLPDYGDENLMAVGFRASVALSVCALLLVPYVVQIIVPWPELRPSLLYVLLSTLSVVVPFMALALVNYEFPTLAAGIVGLCSTTLLTVCGVGLGPHQRKAPAPADAKAAKDAEEGFGEGTVPEEGPAPPASAEKEMKEMAGLEVLAETGVTFTSEADKPQTSNSAGSLKNKAVNSEVVLDKKAMLALHQNENLTVTPAKIHGSIQEVHEGPEHAKDITVQIDDANAERFNAKATLFDCVFRTMPLWLTVLLLILTRIEPIGLKALLRAKEPEIVNASLGTLGHLQISAVGRFSLTQILGTDLGWAYDLLYIPFILPFVVAGCASLLVFRKELETPPLKIVAGVWQRIQGPAVALSGALMLVELLRTSDALKDAPAIIIGTRLSETLSHGFVVLSFPLGALGSFFSGSTTVSNLTFTQVQKVAADTLGVSSTGLIGLQLCGASSGNAFCLSNIIAATAVIGLKVPEGAIVKRVLKPVFAQFVICTLVLLPFIYA